MSPESPAAGEPSQKRNPGERRRLGQAGRLLILLVLFNVVVLAAFSIDRRSRIHPGFCANCHNMTTHVDSYLNSNHMDAAHRRANVGCKDCHFDYSVVDEARSVVNYVLGDFDEVFSRHRFSDEMCNGCHVGMEFQADKTDHLRRNPHRGHYPDLRCGACHLAHARQVDYCGRCHDNGGQRMTEEPKIVRAVAPWQRMTTPGLAAGEHGSVRHD